MKKTLVAAALLLVVGTTQSFAAPTTTKHPEERNILSTELPATLQTSIKHEYAGYWITELVKEGEEKRVKYTLTLENADQVLHLKAGKGGAWELVTSSVKE